MSVQTLKRTDASPASKPNTRHFRVLIIGGGTAGISTAARLVRHFPGQVAVLEPANQHFYQPAWTLVGAGTFRKEATARPMSSVIPKGVTWIQDAAAGFEPDNNQVTTQAGSTITYDQLVVALGLQLRWDLVTGLAGNVGKHGICSNYSFETVSSTWETLRNLKRGTAIFTHPKGALKCGGAPQKICYLADDFLRRQGVRDQCHIVFASATPTIFGVEHYRPTFEKIVERKQIETLFKVNLVEVKAEQQIAVFENLDTGETFERSFDMLHVSPPQRPVQVVADSPLADKSGWVEVDHHTLQHQRFPNVWASGDCAGLPTGRTGAAVRKQVPVLVKNMLASIKGKPLTPGYHGYTSCPVVTGYGKLVLAEFDYDQKPCETFPFDQAKERRSMYWLKKYLLPKLYWWGMLKGRA